MAIAPVASSAKRSRNRDEPEPRMEGVVRGARFVLALAPIHSKEARGSTRQIWWEAMVRETMHNMRRVEFPAAA
jgi:hypothetical protein